MTSIGTSVTALHVAGHARQWHHDTSLSQPRDDTNKVTTHNYVFGYGSLICSYSRRLTSSEQGYKTATPVRVKGLQRVWCKRTNRGMTAMGVCFKENAECLGVMLPVNEVELKAFDQREKGYDRKLLHLDSVDLVPFLKDDFYRSHEAHEKFKLLKDKRDHDSVRLWVYEPRQPLPPSPKYPILQSYLDVILRGCLTIDDKFAKEFIENTIGWHPSEVTTNVDNAVPDDEIKTMDTVWFDDRHNPVYPRGDPAYSRRQARELDRLLFRYCPQHFVRRKVLNAFPLKQ